MEKQYLSFTEIYFFPVWAHYNHSLAELMKVIILPRAFSSPFIKQRAHCDPLKPLLCLIDKGD